MNNPTDDAVERLRADREQGASALAREAVEILAATPPPARHDLAEHLAALRPSMPAIAAIAREAAAEGGPKSVQLS